MEQDLLNNELINNLKSRRKLLPWWIKICIWIFLTLAVIVPFAAIFGIIGYKFPISLYGLETNEPLSITGVFLMIIFFLKGSVAYGLWTEKDWAINLGFIDAILGLSICAFAMFIYPFIATKGDSASSFRLEVLFLVPYLLKLLKIKGSWALQN